MIIAAYIFVNPKCRQLLPRGRATFWRQKVTKNCRGLQLRVLFLFYVLNLAKKPPDPTFSSFDYCSIKLLPVW